VLTLRGGQKKGPGAGARSKRGTAAMSHMAPALHKRPDAADVIVGTGPVAVM